jgi:hypothetical protein
MEKAGEVVCTPSRETESGRKIASYDDRYRNIFKKFKFLSLSGIFCLLIMFFVARMILDYAAKNGGIVVSRDNYRDLMRVGIRNNPRGPVLQDLSTRTSAAFWKSAEMQQLKRTA